MATAISPDDVFVATLEPLVAALMPWEEQLAKFNELPGIPWHLREKVRSYEGKVYGLYQTIVEEFDKLDTPAGKAAVERFWGPLEDD